MSHDQSTLGAFEIIEQIGAGGMATVYKAYQPKLDRYVAVKVMHKMFLEDKNFLSRFEREARIVARLDHPNIVPVYDYDQLNGQPYLVMKLIEGQTLKDHMRERPLNLEEIRYVMGAVCDALSYAHREGVFHRDMKPSNIIIDQSGVPYLTDFGLARVAHQGESTMSVDTMLGTPHYISPEQAQGGAIDARTDVYSIGVILYELVTGRLPFTGENAYAIVHKHIYAAPPQPSQLNPEVPHGVELVLLKALEKEPGKRYSTPNDLIQAFENAVQATGLDALDASRVDRAAQLGDLISQHTPGGSPYDSVKGRSRAFVNENGRKAVDIPVLPPGTSVAGLTLGEWLEVFVQRFRDMIEDLRRQWSERSLQERISEAARDLESSTQQVANTAKATFDNINTPTPQGRKTAATAQSAQAGTAAVRVEPVDAFEMSETAIRKRAKRRVNMRTGLIIHLLVYLVVIGVLLLVHSPLAQGLREGIAENPAAMLADLNLKPGQEARAVQIAQRLADIPLWLMIGALWGAGLFSHFITVIDHTARFRIHQRQQRIESEMTALYGADWRYQTTPKVYKRIRRSIENQSKRRVGLMTHAGVTGLLLIGIYSFLPTVETMAFEMSALTEDGLIQYPTGWAAMSAFVLLTILVIRAIIYVMIGIFGSDDKEMAIQREMARERQHLSTTDAESAKRKIEDLTPPGVRLTQDGEFTDSFMEEVEQTYK